MNSSLLKKALAKHPLAQRLFFSDEDMRWATPKVVADYRAERLKCDVIADLCCGIGLQAFSFAEQCKNVYAVEIDERKLDCARKNAEVLGIKNIVFIKGNILDDAVIEKINESEIVFCDPERLASEDKRKVENIKPDIKELLDKYRNITDEICIEFPPQIKKISLDCEKEYVSIDGRLNRLNLYFGSLKRSNLSAVSLPSKARIEAEKKERLRISSQICEHIYEVDSALVKSGLASGLNAKLLYSGRNTYLTSDKVIESAFIVNSFFVSEVCDFEVREIRESLRRQGAKLVEIRFNVEPKDYWRIRNSFEKGLEGDKKLYLFKIKDKAVIARKV
ncbi:methyltransferase domain-containing protein [Candidatus Woesearchaeota archaeon]|nr:methyltransferase domain-containing protein [Candidatus Woesearchaeota archaeon]